MPMHYEQIKISDETFKTGSAWRNNAGRKEFQAPDGNVYVITRNEIITVPNYVGTPWRAADSDLELVGKQT